jgi:hypothetical protein
MTLDPATLAALEDASAHYRRVERLNAPRGRHADEPVADHLAHELKAAAHETWYVSQDFAENSEVPMAAAEIAARGRPVTAQEIIIHRRKQAMREVPSKGPADVGSMPPCGAAMTRRWEGR